MRKELEELWQYYHIEVPLQRNDNEKEIISKCGKSEEFFRTKLNDEQKELLEEYEKSIFEKNSVSERYAFIKGVRFATRLIFEAFCDD